jgi:hypothetical protein
MKTIFHILLFVGSITIAAAQTKTPIVAGDLMKIVTTNQIQISPDGSRAALVVNQ